MKDELHITNLTDLVVYALEQAEAEEDSFSVTTGLPREHGPGGNIKTTIKVEYTHAGPDDSRGVVRLESISYDPAPHILISDTHDEAVAIDEEVMHDYAEMVGLGWEEALESAIASMGEPGAQPQVQFFSVRRGDETYNLEDEWGNWREYRIDEVPLWFCDAASYEISEHEGKRVEEAMREALSIDWGENAEIGTTSPDGSLVKIRREVAPGTFDADIAERHDFHKWGAAIQHPEKGWLYENGGQSWDPYEEIINPAFPRHPEDAA